MQTTIIWTGATSSSVSFIRIWPGKRKIAGHFVDGNHRAAALNCGKIGSKDDAEGKKVYFVNVPHTENNVVAVIIMPCVPIDRNFANKMRSISQKSQSTYSKQQSHTVQENLSHVIEIVRKQCVGKVIGYHWSVLGEEMKNDVERGEIERTLQDDNYSCFKQYTKHVTTWIKLVSQEIIQVLSKENNLGLSSDKELSNLFKAKVKPTSADYSGYHIFLFSKINMLVKFMKTDPNDVFKPRRFLRTGYTDKVYIFVQIVIWSMIYKEANLRLRLFFSNSNPKQQNLMMH